MLGWKIPAFVRLPPRTGTTNGTTIGLPSDPSGTTPGRFEGSPSWQSHGVPGYYLAARELGDRGDRGSATRCSGLVLRAAHRGVRSMDFPYDELPAPKL